MADPASKTRDQEAPSGASVPALTPSEQSVRFINSEVLAPPEQGSISFVKPFAEQVAVMALEDGRSFLQGMEQILLVAIAKALEKLLSGGAAPPEVLAVSGSDPGPLSSVNQALQAAERLLKTLPQFQASLADTVLRVRTAEQAGAPAPPI
jgi:hypothetical protein